MRRCDLLPELRDLTRPLTDDEHAAQILARREFYYPLCVHRNRHASCYRCIDDVIHELQRKRNTKAVASFVERRRGGRPFRESLAAAKRMLRNRRSGEKCPHQLRPYRCDTCVEIQAIYVREEQRNGAPAQMTIG